MKILFAVLGCLSLCSCELSPAPEEADIPLHPQMRSGLANPRNYMDKDDPNVQRLISSHYMQ